MSEAVIQPLLTGSAGQVGSVLAELMSQRFPRTVCATRVELDITDLDRLNFEVERLRPDLIVNCAAMTDVDGCERDPERAYLINRDGPRALARAAAAVGARLIHLSTDFVFDGARQSPYDEEASPRPLSVYGRSKWEGEQAVMEETDDHVIVRTSWVFGGEVAGFVNAVLARGREGRPLQVVADQIGGPTFRDDLARAVLRIVAIPYRGILHFANEGHCSRDEFARQILRGAGISAPVEPIPTIPRPGLAQRPGYSVLDTTRYRRLTGAPVRHWKEALRECLDSRRDRPDGGCDAGRRS